jgi:hypothetical protein
MREPPDDAELCSRLQAALGEDVSVSVTYVLGDLLWDIDMTAADYRDRGSVSIEKKQSQRRVILMLVRNELRFWLTTDKDPYGVGAKSGLGTLPSFDAAVTLCEEFIRDDVAIERLTTPPRAIYHDVHE